MSAGTGTVSSHTTIRVAGNVHAAEVPFVLVLVDADDGGHELGRWDAEEPPAVGTRVALGADDAGRPLYQPT